MTTVEVEYDCCGALYRMPTALKEDQTLLANAALGDTLIMQADAMHDAQHPECDKWNV